MYKLRSIASFMALLGCFILVLEILIKVMGIRQFLLPSPSQVILSIIAHRNSLVQDTLATTLQTVLGFCVAFLLASFVGGFVFAYPRFRPFVVSVAVALKAVPILILAPIFLVWFGYGPLGKVILAAIVTTFPIFLSIVHGLETPKQDERDLFLAMRASRFQTILYLYIPRSVPSLILGLQVAAPMAVLGSLIGESAGATRGLGQTMIIAAANFDTPLLFASALISGLLGVASYGLVEMVGMLFAKYFDT
jgi:NitT/TauT family transport system permease protein